MQQKPKNHHFVPQHFLKSWEIRKKIGKIFRYKFIDAITKFECKIVSIKHTASLHNLYDVVLPDGEFEIESSVVTPKLDEAGQKILKKVRAESIQNFNKNEKRELAIYFVCLEARHPEILKDMNIVPDLNKMNSKKLEEFFGTTCQETVKYFKEIKSTGSMTLSAFIQNERMGILGRPFSSSLLKANCVEIEFESDVLISSDYPVCSFGGYKGNILVIISVSLRKALVYTTSIDIIEVFNELPLSLLADLINVYTLMNASCGYFNDDTKKEFIKVHVGWSKKAVSVNNKKKYIYDFIESGLRNYA